MNVVCIVGRLTATPTIKMTNSGLSVSSFRVAVNRGKEADFFDVTAWRQTAEYVCKYGQKGDTVEISGSLHTREWTDKDGNKRKAVEIVAQQIHVRAAKRQEQDCSEQNFEVADDEDLPF